jgi:glycosyltransferase involved in cell wall biosynthesis
VQAVGVIITTYNRENLVCRAIESALCQSLPADWDLQVVVVDDGSQDETVAKIVEQFSLQWVKENTKEKFYANHKNLTLIASPNRERGAARNLGFGFLSNQYKTKWILFLDSDDVLNSHTLHHLLQKGESTGAVATFGNSLIVDSKRGPVGLRFTTKPTDGWLRDEIFTEFRLAIGTSLIHADTFRAVGGFSEKRELSGSEDWHLWCRLAQKGQFLFVPHIANEYMRHSSNTSAKRLEQSIIVSRQDVLSHFPHLSSARRRAIFANAYLRIAGTYNAEYAWRSAWRFLAKAVFVEPCKICSQVVWRTALSSIFRAMCINRNQFRVRNSA